MGHNCYTRGEITRDFPLNIPASRFLRPYSSRVRILESLRLRRILDDLTYAAKRGLVFHLWWHPHNFGINLEENISFLTRILDHYTNLRDNFAMESLNMGELAQRLTGETHYHG